MTANYSNRLRRSLTTTLAWLLAFSPMKADEKLPIICCPRPTWRLCHATNAP